MTLYFDASAFVKLFLTERGSERARELWAVGGPATSSWITFAETSAAIGAAERSRRLSRRNARRALELFHATWATITALHVHEDTARAAGSLAHAHALRGMDAIHLASACSIAQGGVVMVTADVDLARAASYVGLGVAPV